jgi:hypothetical protein
VGAELQEASATAAAGNTRKIKRRFVIGYLEDMNEDG